MSAAPTPTPPPARDPTLRNAVLAGAGFAVAALGVAAALTLMPPPVGVSDDSPVAPRASLAPNESLVEPGAAEPKTRSPRVPVAAACEDCGVVESVRSVQKKGEGTGLGAVAGGVLGGALGNQMGKGGGRDAMTVIGVVGGGLAGHEIEKRTRSEIVYEVRVRMDDGRLRTLQRRSAPAVGARVQVQGTRLTPLDG